MVRNFYGVLHVRDDSRTTTTRSANCCTAPSITANRCSTTKLRYVPTSYYGDQFGRRPRDPRGAGHGRPIRVGVIGLGAGVLSTYGREGDYYRIYEINPLVAKIAQTEFTLLSAFARRQDRS